MNLRNAKKRLGLDNDPGIIVSVAISSLMLNKKLNQIELSKISGIKQEAISRAINFHPVTVRFLSKLAKSTGTELKIRFELEKI